MRYIIACMMLMFVMSMYPYTSVRIELQTAKKGLNLASTIISDAQGYGLEYRQKEKILGAYSESMGYLPLYKKFGLRTGLKLGIGYSIEKSKITSLESLSLGMYLKWVEIICSYTVTSYYYEWSIGIGIEKLIFE